MNIHKNKMYKRILVSIFLVVIALVVTGLFSRIDRANAQSKTVVCPADGKFHIKEAVICDPEGKPFLPRGINDFAGQTFGGFEAPNLVAPNVVSAYVDGWKFNTLRIVMCPTGPCRAHPTTVQGTDIDQVISTYTARKVVIILDYHQTPLAGPVTAGDVAEAVPWFKEMAIKYKDNPYVWLETFNEPIDGNDGIQTWLGFTTPIVDAVRSVNPDKIVVVCSGNYGQDSAGNGDGFDQGGSHILNGGQSLKAKGNVMFDMHFYSRWMNVNPNGVKNYFKAIHDAGFAVLIGETWGDPNGADFMRGDQQATNQLYAARPNGVGILPWSAAGNYPATTGGRAPDINSNTNPTNLTANGQAHWNWTHNPPSAVPDGYTVTTGGGPTMTSTPGTCPAKSRGDADCNGIPSVTDYAVWRAEYKGGCSSTNLTAAACGDNKDNIGTIMDADFNGDNKVSLVDYQAWRAAIKGTPGLTTAPTNKPGVDPSLKITVSAANHGSVVLENSVMKVSYSYTEADGYGEFAIQEWINKLAGNRDITKQISAPRPGGVAGRDFLNVQNCEQFVSGGKENINKTQLTGTIINDGTTEKTVRITQDCGITEEFTVYANSPVLKVNYVSYTYDWIDNRNSRNIDKPGDPFGQAEPHDVVIYGSETWLQTNNYLCTGSENTFCQNTVYDRLGIGGRSDPADGGPLSYKGNFIMGFTEKATQLGYGRTLPVARLGTWWVHINESYEYLFHHLSGPNSQGPPFIGHLFMVNNGPTELLSIGKSAVDGTIVTR